MKRLTAIAMTFFFVILMAANAFAADGTSSQTGDSNSMYLYLAVLLICALVIILMVVSKIFNKKK